MQEFRDLYIQTARERIQQLNETLLKLEKNPDQLDIVEELMRTGHSLKGESGAMGFEQIATLAHVVEDLFTAIGAGQMEITREIMDALFEAFDYIEESVNAIASDPTAKDLDSKSHVEKIKKLTGLKTEGFGKSQKGEASKPDASAQEKTPQDESSKEAEPTKQEASKKEPPKDQPATTNAPKKTDQKIETVTLKVDKLDKMVNISEELILLKMKLKNSQIVDENSQLKADVHRLDRLVTDMQFHIMQTRLFPISLAMSTLPRLVRDISKKTNKEVDLILEGQDTTVDRTIIDHLTEPFVHMIRNAIDHGIESAQDRKAAGKSKTATVTVAAYTKENKFYVDIKDDGRGIEWDKLVASSIKKGAIDADTVSKWDLEQKKRLLFLDGVSTSEEVTDVSGRGVGMSAVERAIKNLGGQILVKTQVGVGTTFTLVLPLTLAISQALLVRIKDRTYAIPSSGVIRSIQVSSNRVKSSANKPVIVVDDQKVSLVFLQELFGLTESEPPATQETSPQIQAAPAQLDHNDPELIKINNQIKQVASLNTEEGVEPQPEPEKTKEVPAHPVVEIIEEEKKTEFNQNKILTIVLIRDGIGMFGCVVDKILAEEEILVKQLGPLLKHQSVHFSGATILADGTAAPIINTDGINQ